MKKSLLVGILTAIAPASLLASVHSAYYKADFSSGSLPSTLKTENVNSLLPDEKYYRQGFTSNGWTVSVVGSKYAAVSPTHTLSDEASCNRLTTPVFNVESEEAIVRWSARSLVSDCPESYKVMICEDGSDSWETITNIDGESSAWVYRIASLKAYVGKNVKLAFECNSVNKYLLALTDIFIGTVGDDNFFTIDKSVKFPALEEAAIEGTILNIGREYKNAGIQVRVSNIVVDNEKIEDFATGDEFSYYFPIDVVKNEKNNFSVEIVDGEGNAVTVAEGIIFPSDFARNQMIDEGTAMWCNNCPKAVVQLENLRRQFPEQIITIATHANDKFAEMDYWTDLQFYAIPYFKANRQNATSDINRLTESLYLATEASISINECCISNDENTIEVEVSALFSQDKNNKEDNLRVGYVVTGDFHSDSQESGIYQENGILMASGEQYYFLPTRIPTDMVWLHDVTLTSATAFSGYPKSLTNAVIPANQPDYFNFSISMNDLMKDADKLNVVTFLIDTSNGSILNACEAEVVNQRKVENVTEDLLTKIILLSDGIIVDCPTIEGKYSAALYKPDGSIAASASGDNLSGVKLSFAAYSPLYLLKIEANGKIITKRILR